MIDAQRLGEIQDRWQQHAATARAQLADLVAIPSISVGGAAQPEAQARSAAHVAELCRAAGLQNVEILYGAIPTSQGPIQGAPAVVGEIPGPPGAPTVLLYAHHDVQPVGELSHWDSDPFTLTERDGRLFGRGAADDKAGIVLHLSALALLGAECGVGIRVFFEGEEECGSPSFTSFLETYRDRLSADVIVVADSDNWSVTEPSLTVSLRGLVEFSVTVSTLTHAVHSGMYGGAVPDATMAMVTLLSRIWNPDGSLAVPVQSGPAIAGAPDLSETELREGAGAFDSTQVIGSHHTTIAQRLWTEPSLTITGMDIPRVREASNTLQGSITAKGSLRVPPGVEPAAAYEALAAFLRAQAPWGATVDVTLLETGAPWLARVGGETYDIARAALTAGFGHPPVHSGIGGSIPFIAELERVFPEATVLVVGVEDPDTRAHGANESLHWSMFGSAVVSHTLLLDTLGRCAPSPTR